MKFSTPIGLVLLLVGSARADTPAPGTVKAKTYTGDGVTAITSTGASGALDVNVTNSGGLSTVSQGTAGTDPWFVSVRNNAPLPVNACQETGGNLAAIASELGAPLAVTGTFWQTTQPVSIAASVPVTGTFFQTVQPVVVASPLPAGTNNIGTVDINGTVPISGSLTANQGTPGPLASPWPVTIVALPSPVPVTGTFWQATQPVSGTFFQSTQPVSGTFWQTTQPVSATSLPLPTGASTSAKQPALGTAGTASGDVITIQGHSGMTAVVVDGSGVTQPVSVASLPLPTGAATSSLQSTGNTTLSSILLDLTNGSQLTGITGTVPLPTGAATAAKQPALGTAGTASADVLSVQGVASMTALKVDGSGVTQPVSIAASVPVTGTFWQATQPVSGTFFQSTQPVSATSLPLPTGASTSAKQPALGTAGTASSDVLTVQGITSMTALKVDGSGVTQPISGTVTVNQGTQGVGAWPVLAAQSGTWTSVLGAGSAIIGKMGIDQTTPGTTNGVQVNAAIPAGTNVIGKVSIDQTTPGTTNLVALAADQSVNLAQVNGVTTLAGNGTAGTGAQRVTIASDNTPFTVNANFSTPTALTVKQAAVTIGTTAVRLTNNGSAPASTRVLLAVQLISTSAANCYFGSSTVTTTSTTRGVQFFAGQTLSFSHDAGDYFGICDTATQTVYITEQE